MPNIKTTNVKPSREIEDKAKVIFTEFCQLSTASGRNEVGELRSWLMETLGLGYANANTLAQCVREHTKSDAAPNYDPLSEIYSGSKAHLRSLHEKLILAIAKIGPHEQAAKKTYISLRRKKQFAMLGPATKEAVELGLNAKQLEPTNRLKAVPPGRMCQFSVRLSTISEIDTELLNWVRAAYDAAG